MTSVDGFVNSRAPCRIKKFRKVRSKTKPRAATYATPVGGAQVA